VCNERDAVRSGSAEERRRVRQEETVDAMVRIKAQIDAMLPQLSRQSDLAKAMRYTLGHWAGLVCFLEDGRLEVDTNTVERGMRNVAMGESLHTPSSSVCKHWKRAGVGSATRGTLPGHRSFYRCQRQVICSDLIGRTRNDLLCRKDTRFDETSYGVARNA
jgi:transposase